MRKWHGVRKFLIIDLDAHQGNGHERDLGDDPEVHIIDAYNPYIYPGDVVADKKIGTRIHVSHLDDDESYFRKLTSSIPKVFEKFRPDFVIYNAGTDCMANDPLGGMNLSNEMIVRRD